MANFTRAYEYYFWSIYLTIAIYIKFQLRVATLVL